MKRFTASSLLHCFLLAALSAPAQQALAYQPYAYQAPPGVYPQRLPENTSVGQTQPYQQQPYQQAPYQPQPYQRFYQPQPYQAQPYQAQPYWNPYQQQQQAPVYQPPRIETSISDATPYEQQSLVYTIRIISSGNLKTATPEIPQTTAAVLRTLGDPVTESDKKEGPQEMVTEYRYLLMPLSSGLVSIPPAKVTGNYAGPGGGEGPSFEISGRPVVLQVRPATDAVQPWLPLYNLQITARVRGGEAPAAGNPIELVVETKAVGATGTQIPSVANYLASDEFRIYPGKSETEGTIAADGKTLLGHRIENFTLVPQYGGWLKLPSVTMNWWNVRYNRPEVAALLTDQINVMGPANPARGGFGGASSGPLGAFFFWLPMGVAVAMLMVGWLSAFMGDGRLPGTERLRNLVRPALGELYAPVVAYANRISPRRSFHRLRTWTGRHLPVSWKLWFCLRAVAREDDPAEWGQALQILAAKHLGVRPQAHLRELGKSIARCHPRANAEQVERLMAELDEAVYGDKPMRSFARWKREFRKQIKPGLFPVRMRALGLTSGFSRELPGLNPR
jgi:hypothetical protein